MIDSEARKKFALILKEFCRGQLTNFEFEQEIPDTKDPAILAIISSIWLFYDDFEEHKLSGKDSLTGEMKASIERWALFLHSDLEYEWPTINCPGVRPLKHGFFEKLLGAEKKEHNYISSGDYTVWPFLRVQDFERIKKIKG